MSGELEIGEQVFVLRLSLCDRKTRKKATVVIAQVVAFDAGLVEFCWCYDEEEGVKVWRKPIGVCLL